MRECKYNIEIFFKKRFSPREFTDKPISEDDFYAIIEAGTTAPSCFNEQPWRYIVSEKSNFLNILMSENVQWAKNAQYFILICAEPNFSRNGKPNKYAEFDAGTSWGYMTYEAYKRDIYLHAMAGFSKNKAIDIFELGDMIPLAVVAFGHTEQNHTLTPRKKLEGIILKR